MFALNGSNADRCPNTTLHLIFWPFWDYKVLIPSGWVNPLQYVSGCWERELSAILGYPVCSLWLKGPLLYEIFPFCSIHHGDRSPAMTPLSYITSGQNEPMEISKECEMVKWSTLCNCMCNKGFHHFRNEQHPFLLGHVKSNWEVRAVLTASQTPTLGAENARASHSPVYMERNWWREENHKRKKQKKHVRPKHST